MQRFLWGDYPIFTFFLVIVRLYRKTDLINVGKCLSTNNYLYNKRTRCDKRRLYVCGMRIMSKLYVLLCYRIPIIIIAHCHVFIIISNKQCIFKYFLCRGWRAVIFWNLPFKTIIVAWHFVWWIAVCSKSFEHFKNNKCRLVVYSLINEYSN